MPQPVQTRTLNVFEVFERANRLTPQDQAQLFTRNKHPAVMQCAQLAFGNFGYLIHTEATIPYVASNEEAPASNLHKRYGEVAFIVKGAGHDDKPPMLRENIWARLLEAIHPADAQFLNDIVQGKFKQKYPNVSQAALAAAFPGVVSEPTNEDIPVVSLEPEVVEDSALNVGEPVTQEAVNTRPEGKPEIDVKWLGEAAGDAEHLAEMDEDTFGDLRRAVMRENHKRNQEKKKD